MPLPEIFFLTVFCFLTLRLCHHDLRDGLLPDRLTCPLLWCGLLFNLCLRPGRLADAVTGAMVGYSALAVFYWLYRGLRGKEGIGYGDIKLLASLGAWLGWQMLPIVILLASGLALSFLTVRLLITRQLVILNNPLPFGPFLTAAGFITGWLLWPNQLL